MVELKLGVRGKPGVPRRDSEAWCRHIDELVGTNLSSSAANVDSSPEVRATAPSFACDEINAGTIEAMICDDEVLSALDRTLAGAYGAALKKAANESPPLLKAEQRG